MTRFGIASSPRVRLSVADAVRLLATEQTKSENEGHAAHEDWFPISTGMYNQSGLSEHHNGTPSSPGRIQL